LNYNYCVFRKQNKLRPGFNKAFHMTAKLLLCPTLNYKIKLKAFSCGGRFVVNLFKASPNSNYIFMKLEPLHEAALSPFDVWLK
jgi:hypothetical protein